MNDEAFEVSNERSKEGLHYVRKVFVGLFCCEFRWVPAIDQPEPRWDAINYDTYGAIAHVLKAYGINHRHLYLDDATKRCPVEVKMTNYNSDNIAFELDSLQKTQSPLQVVWCQGSFFLLRTDVLKLELLKTHRRHTDWLESGNGCSVTNILVNFPAFRELFSYVVVAKTGVSQREYTNGGRRVWKRYPDRNFDIPEELLEIVESYLPPASFNSEASGF